MSSAAEISPEPNPRAVVMGRELPRQLGEGWLTAEETPDHGAFRWTTGRARLSLPALAVPTRLCLRIGVPALPLAKPVSVMVQGRRVWRGRMSVGLQDIEIDLPQCLTSGETVEITLMTRLSRPSDWVGGPDERWLGVLVAHVRLEPSPAASSAVALRARWRDWLSPLWAGWRERNIWRPRSPWFWVIMPPLFALCLLAGLILRPLRALGLSPRVDRSRRPLPPRSISPEEFKELQRRIYSDTQQVVADRYQSVEVLRQTLAMYEQRAGAGAWSCGLLRDQRTLRLWRSLHLHPDMRILDVGCQAGYTLELLRMHFGVTGVGCDLASTPLEAAQDVCGNRHRFFLSDAEALPLRPGSLDLIHSQDVLEHLSDADTHLRQAAQALSPGGRLVIYAVSGDRSLTWHEFKTIVTGGRLSGFPPEGVDRAGHSREYFPRAADLRAVLEEEGLCVSRLIRYHAFFTLIFDECYALFHSRPEIWATRPRLCRWAVRGISLLERVFHLADEPWIWAGQSNGFFLVAHRPPNRSRTCG
jgi:SAM-dependent methyltransferase